MLKKIQKSLTQRKFEKMLISGGVLDVLKNQIKILYQGAEKQETDVFSLLEESLILVSLFQEKNKRRITKSLHFYLEDQSVSTHLMPLYIALQRLGRDCFKEDQDKTIVCNKTHVGDIVSKETIFVYTDYCVYAPQRLDFIIKQAENPIGLINESMVKELENVLPVLLNENLFKIYDSIESLQKLVLSK